MTKKQETEVLSMQVRKRNGSLEAVDLNKIVRAVSRCCAELPGTDPLKIATKTIAGLYDGATTKELDWLSIKTASSLIAEEPEYGKVAARLLNNFIAKEVEKQEISSFSQSVAACASQGLLNQRFIDFVNANKRKLNMAIDESKNDLFDYFGISVIYDRYLMKHPDTRQVLETPQYWLMRVACGLSVTPAEAVELYKLLSSLDYLPSTPTLFNAGLIKEQMSSCYLMPPPEDSIEGIYGAFKDAAFLSKYAGGIGLPWHTIRSFGSHIKGTNGKSNGLVPWLKIFDSSVGAVNQGGRRKGAAAVYLETWHADIEEFLELRDNTGDGARRTHNLNLAHWIPDLFMRRVEEDGEWSLFDPHDVPSLVQSYGPAFEALYVSFEQAGLAKRVVKARELYSKMMRTLAETGNGWMCFKDASNIKCPQVMNADTTQARIVQSSNLCTEIIEVSRTGQECAVCNLASMNLIKYIKNGEFDFKRFSKNVKIAVKHLDRVIDLNFYPISIAEESNKTWRPIGLGLMGLQDVFFALKLPFDSDKAKELSVKIQEEMYFSALTASTDLAEAVDDTFPAYNLSEYPKLQFEYWGVEKTEPRWVELKERIEKVGLRNSLLIAIAPTATIGSISGSYECTEPQISNMFKRETLSGEFIQMNKYLVTDLKALGLWTEEVRNKIKMAEGSIQDIQEIPEDIRFLYRTVWELSMKTLIDMAAARAPYIDQSQSLNLFVESPNIGKLSSMYMHVFKSGLKTSYYLRSRPATRINKTTVASQMTLPFSNEQVIACSLENPTECEACQ